MTHLPTLALFVSSAAANSGGRTGHTTSGCGGCHGSTADGTTTVTISAPSSEVGIGESIVLTIRVGTASSSRTHAGFNVGATAGTFTAGSGSTASSGELTQSAPLAMSGGVATWTVTWTAPSTAGPVTLRGVGNAVNDNGRAGGDGWALADDLVLDVVCQDEDGDGDTTCDGDCDDQDDTVGPSQDETCNGIDDDCDGGVDEDAADATLWYADADGDGYGAPGTGLLACTQPSGTVTDDTDCDDSDALTSPAGAEVCGGGDEDCDGLEDDADGSVTGTTDWFADDDGDGFGGALVVAACAGPSGTVPDPGDCDDADPLTFPGAPEACSESIDRNCDGATGSRDGDGDGFAACEDCDDTDAARNPGASEMCNGLDDDCDGEVDGSTAADATDWFADDDGDGYGDPSAVTRACEAPTGHVDNEADCDDGDERAFPGADEVPYDGVDQNCDGADLCDVDRDGADAVECEGRDCDDADPTVNPLATEAWYDGIDQDCDGNDDDQDGDGFGRSDDCDDGDASRFPGDGTLDADCQPVRTASGESGGTGCGNAKAALLLVPIVTLGLRRRRRDTPTVRRH
ncbi:MAG: MopE-related protein [Myxococcota bacterium]|nr:MopE-related protein [Myxococcota bacterium]